MLSILIAPSFTAGQKSKNLSAQFIPTMELSLMLRHISHDEFDFMVYLKTGKTLTGKSLLYQKRRRRFIQIKKKIIKPFQTDSLKANSFTGYPLKDYWLFRIRDGRISVYSKKPIRSIGNYDFLRKGNGDYQRYSIDRLEKMVSSNTVVSAD